MKYFIVSVWKSYLKLATLPDLYTLKRAFATDTYTFGHSNFPNVGYYCLADGLQIPNIPPRHCILHCLLMQDCATLNYNNTAGLCVLLPTACTLAFRQESTEYVMLTGRNHEQCLKWVPVTESGGRVVNSTGGFSACRLQVGDGTFLGHFLAQSQMCWATDGNTQHDWIGNPSEILTISPECTMGWMKYTADSPIPPTAMVAGRSYVGDNLYVALLPLPNPHPIVTGYYNVGSRRGYATENGNAHTFNMVDLMILL